MISAVCQVANPLKVSRCWTQQWAADEAGASSDLAAAPFEMSQNDCIEQSQKDLRESAKTAHE